MKNEIKNLFAVLPLLGIIVAAGCSKQQSATGDDSSDGQSKESLIAGIDKHGEEAMASTNKAEARAWMKQPSHVFFKVDSKAVGQFVEDFYQAGATQVLIVDIEEVQGRQFGEALLVVLPKDPTARAKLFEIGARADASYQNDTVTDKGQKYLYYSLD
jgi:hypothetical protein